MGGNNKALLRSRMKEAVKEREKRIDSPLVRYNELGQLACKVCNIVVKSDSLWPAHLVSRQHKEVVEEIKARVKKAGDPQVKPASTEVTRTEVIHSSSVPADFLDSPAVKRAKKADLTSNTVRNDEISSKLKRQIEQLEQPAPLDHTSGHVQDGNPSKGTVPEDFFDSIEKQDFATVGHSSGNAQVGKSGHESKGSLPEGFFDNVDADHKARGLEPPKYDMQDEWKEFQKSIREDLQDVDLRMAEEEFVAAEDREELEYLEQTTLLERIEKLRKRKQEMALLKASMVKTVTCTTNEKNDSSSSDEEDDEVDTLVDWRAKQFK